jgi:hypothetical protein
VNPELKALSQVVDRFENSGNATRMVLYRLTGMVMSATLFLAGAGESRIVPDIRILLMHV